MADDDRDWSGPQAPAFPAEDAENYYKGITIRDYFAAAALTGLIASNDENAGDRITELPGYAYDIADEMLKVRKNGR